MDVLSRQYWHLILPNVFILFSKPLKLGEVALCTDYWRCQNYRRICTLPRDSYSQEVALHLKTGSIMLRVFIMIYKIQKDKLFLQECKKKTNGLYVVIVSSRSSSFLCLPDHLFGGSSRIPHSYVWAFLLCLLPYGCTDGSELGLIILLWTLSQCEMYCSLIQQLHITAI